MGIHYYLCRGYEIDDYWNCSLNKIFKDMKSIEQIDMFTVKFYDLSELKNYLIKNNLINDKEEIVIANNKTDKETKEKRLVPIFQKNLIFGSDLDMLGISNQNYKEIAKELWAYVKERQNNKDFMTFILAEYIEKYESSKRKVKAPIYVNGDIFTLNRIINSKEKSSRDISEYEFSFANFFRNEIFKCERIQTRITFDSIDSESVTVFKPIGDEVNAKGLHDMLLHVIQYAKKYEYDYNEEYEIYKEFTEEELREMEIERICTYLSQGKIIQDCEKEEYMENLKRYEKENIL